MKRLVFRELKLISYKEERARRVAFHPRRTAIIGDNDTGKSSILKSLYRTLGATCHTSLDFHGAEFT
jgi:recombinational DNA repair ATPase RecF